MLAMVALLLGSPGRQRGNPGAIAIVLDTSVSTHIELSGALQHLLPYRTVERTLSQPWSEPDKPIATITLAHGAQKWVDTFAPDRPHAALLRWSSDLVTPTPSAPLLVGSGHTETTCTTEALSQRIKGEERTTTLVIWAAPTDEEAAKIARALDASIVTGGLTELAARLESRPPSTTEIFVRGEPSVSHAVWLERLGQLGKSSSFDVGSDAPGTARFGVEPWIRGDLEAHAAQVSRWLHDQLQLNRRWRRARRTTPAPTQIYIPCAR